jgi:DNA-directed RNA polymerase specialized sigma24 family protein
VPLPPEVVAAVGDVTVGTTSVAERLERLEAALRLLPPAERRAVLAAHASDESGVAEVAEALHLSDEEADALTRSAVQLLRGALADLGPEPPPSYATVQPRRSAAKRRAD